MSAAPPTPQISRATAVFIICSKTFHPGWSDSQTADGTVTITTPTGHTYTSRLYFPGVDTTSAPVQRGSPRKTHGDNRTSKMPKRKRPKAKDRAHRIAAKRALNDAYVAERNQSPDF